LYCERFRSPAADVVVLAQNAQSPALTHRLSNSIFHVSQHDMTLDEFSEVLPDACRNLHQSVDLSAWVKLDLPLPNWVPGAEVVETQSRIA